MTGWLDVDVDGDVEVDDVEPDQVVLSDDIMQVTGCSMNRVLPVLPVSLAIDRA